MRERGEAGMKAAVSAGVCGIFAALFMLPAAAGAHLCDNVYRQKDKVIIKPEFTNLIIKDKCEFKVFIQNNMDRGVVTAGLDAYSDAFDIEVSPHAMPIPKAKSEKDRVSFEVAMALKPGYSSGSYRVNFKLVGRGEEGAGREIASYAIQTGEGAPFYIAAQAVTVSRGSGPAPRIDGLLADECWRKAASFTNFLIEDGSHAHNQSVGLIAWDRRNIYLGLALSDEGAAKEGGKRDRVTVVLARPGGKIHAIEVDSAGKSRVREVVGKDRDLRDADFSVKAGAREDEGRNSWSLELAIPLKDLGASGSAAYGDWQLNVIRHRAAGGEDVSSWAGLPSSAIRYESFGTLRLKRPGG